ncbi:MAG: phosphoribosylaminoimidazolesuccinocarboxamide synthase [Spirochaetota bacterium]
MKIFHGKVRDIIDLGDELLIVATDRVSAFDRVLALVPCKGEVLTRTSLYWFSETGHIIENHVREMVTSRCMRVEKAQVLPVEVVVRGFLAGSAWRDYNAGRDVSGVRLPAGMVGHDEAISEADVVSQGLVDRKTWEQVRETALALFRYGQERAERAGLRMFDTKYEFGLRADGNLILVDELHTPDSSRLQLVTDSNGGGPEERPTVHLDKEYLREYLMERGYRGEGVVPDLPEEVILELAGRYIEAIERLTGAEFEPLTTDPDREFDRILSFAGSL